jgi:PAS domain S-box-containing protein
MTNQYAILLVDDDPFILQGIGLGLKAQGYAVTTADSGRAAIELLKDEAFDLVITDLIMDDVDGIGVLKTCKKIHPDTMVIILTGFADMDSAINALRLIADDYMLKPCELEEVYFRVQRCLDKLEMQRKITRFYIELENRVAERTAELYQSNEKLRREIEHRTQVERKLQKSQEKYRNVVEHSNDGICIVQDYELKYANRRLAEILGYSREEIIDHAIEKYFQPDTIRQINDIYDDFLRRKIDEQRIETVILHKNGYPIDVEMSISMTTYNEHRAGLIFIYDISARKRAEEQIHSLTRQLLVVQESERHKIACDLHDHIAQDLASLKIGCGMLTQNMTDVSESFQHKVGDLSHLLQKVITDVRNLAYALYPTGLRQFGLVDTLYRYCSEFSEKNNIEVSFVTAGMDDLKLDYDTQINLYRLVQEALNNIKKHAQARDVKIRMVASHPHIILRIEDDGKGFDVNQCLREASKQAHMGLHSMQERVNLLDGNIKIQSRPMEGTRIVVEIPCRIEKGAAAFKKTG